MEEDYGGSVNELCQTDRSTDGLEVQMSSPDVKPFKCKCYGVFFSENEYKKHIKDDCEAFKSDFEDVADLKVENDVKKELEIDLEDMKKAEVHTSSQDVKPFSCKCLKLFFNESEYKRHVEDGCEVIKSSSMVVEELKMEIDVPALPAKEELESDEKQNEQNKRIYRCNQCGKVFKYLLSLKDHVERRHTDGVFKCDICNKEYAHKNDLNVHLEEHVETQKSYKCELCGKVYKRKDSFNYHKKSQHQNDGQTHKCDVCDKVFKTKNILRSHQIQVHSTEEKYQCKLCGEKFKSYHKRRSHLRRHGKKGELVENHHTEPNSAAQSTDTGNSGSLCEICQADCSAEGLEVHMSTHDVKLFKCECFKVFFSENEYKDHVKDDCEAVRSGLELVQDFKVENDVIEELKK